MPSTMFDKIWARHVVAEGPGGHVLLYVDRHLLHEGSAAAFARLARAGRRVRRPDLCAQIRAFEARQHSERSWLGI